MTGNWTLRLLFGHFTYWTLRLLVILPVTVISAHGVWRTSHITRSCVLESGVHRQQSLYTQWPVKSVHDHDDGDLARSREWHITASVPPFVLMKWS